MHAMQALQSRQAFSARQRRGAALQPARVVLPHTRPNRPTIFTSTPSSRRVHSNAIPGLEGLLVDVELAEVVEAGTAVVIGIGAWLSSQFKVSKKAIEYDDAAEAAKQAGGQQFMATTAAASEAGKEQAKK